MHEHRLYEIERWKNGKIIERQVLLCTPKRATMYRIQGWEVFDYHDSLGMEPEYFKKHAESILYEDRFKS